MIPSNGDEGADCSDLGISADLPIPVRHVSALTHAELGEKELWAYDADGKPVAHATYDGTSRSRDQVVHLDADTENPTIRRFVFQGRPSLLYALTVRP